MVNLEVMFMNKLIMGAGSLVDKQRKAALQLAHKLSPTILFSWDVSSNLDIVHYASDTSKLIRIRCNTYV